MTGNTGHGVRWPADGVRGSRRHEDATRGGGCDEMLGDEDEHGGGRWRG